MLYKFIITIIVIENYLVLLQYTVTSGNCFQILLEAPDDILCFKFCPTDPNFVAGGCISGQVVLWDIAEHSNRLRQARAGKSKDPLNALVCCSYAELSLQFLNGDFKLCVSENHQLFGICLLLGLWFFLHLHVDYGNYP